MNRAPDAVRLAVGTLTVFPVQAPTVVDARTAGPAMLLAPLAVAPVALAAGTVGWVAGLTAWPGLVGGLLVVAVLALGTRAIHLDGLADTVDGLGSGRERSRALEIMRRGDVGPMGVVALVLTLALQAAAAGQLVGSWGDAALLAALICGSRAALAIACRRGIPSARPDGLGVAVAGTVSPVAALACWLVVLAVVSGVTRLADVRWWAPAAGVLLGALVATLLVRRSVRVLGGITGDVLGAAVELAFLVMVLVAVL